MTLASNIGTQIGSEVNDYVFRKIHSNTLIYNACWEDPRIDRQLMALDSQSKVVVLTSAGCNTLDYLLDSPAEIHAVDVNPHQNALLELKLVALQELDHQSFFELFGKGAHSDAENIINGLSSEMTSTTQRFWQKKHYYFEKPKNRGSFYYCGSSGKVAWFFRNYYLRVRRTLREGFSQLLAAQNMTEQQAIYESVENVLWDRTTSWLVKQPVVMAMLGVPTPQIQLMHRSPGRSVQAYVTERIRHVFTQIPIRDNYFWRVYLTGQYTPECCPNYLKEENLLALRQSSPKVFPHTMTIADFLRCNPSTYSHFVLLDHQDWMAAHAPEALEEEWNLILANSRPGTKILIRSASPELDFLPSFAEEALQFLPEQSDPLHQTDRVGTYASLHFAEVR
ncbi:MAG: BtaA family protein [Chloroflexota bacterium]